MNTKKLTQLLVMMVFPSLIGLSSFAQNQEKQENQINFSKFNVSSDKKKISIDWSIENAAPANYFEVQKSNDGINFKTIALVLGPDPKQITGDYYAYFDKYVRKYAKHSYYRLKHIGTNGVEQLSEAKLLAKS